MSRASTHTHPLPPRKYAELIAEFPLRPLHDDVDYGNALEVAETLVGLARPTEDQADYLDVLADIIQKYEANRYPIGGKRNPIAMLKKMMDEQGMTGSDLGRLLGNRQLGSLILNGQRDLSKAHIVKLSHHFKVRAELFLGA